MGPYKKQNCIENMDPKPGSQCDVLADLKKLLEGRPTMQGGRQRIGYSLLGTGRRCLQHLYFLVIVRGVKLLYLYMVSSFCFVIPKRKYQPPESHFAEISLHNISAYSAVSPCIVLFVLLPMVE